MVWRGALLLCLGCHFDPAGLEGRPAPCLEDFIEVDGFCFSADVGEDAGRGDASDGTDARVPNPDAGTPSIDATPFADALELDGAFDANRPDGDCRCEGTRLVGCDPCDDGLHIHCHAGVLETGPSCVNEVTVATCDGDEEILGGCVSGCSDSDGWGCDFEPLLIPSTGEATESVAGDELIVDTDRHRVTIDGRAFRGDVERAGDNVVVYVSTLDVRTISVEGEGGVAIRASDTIRIREGIDVSARGPIPGPGGFATEEVQSTPCGLGARGGGPGGGGAAGRGMGGLGGGGGGGGGYGTTGGDGGSAGSCTTNGDGGGPHEPGFHGGSAGGGSQLASGGGGGGAVYLSARVAIFADGVIDASGGGGGADEGVGGSGGGSGGLILLEAPLLVSSGLTLIANGGGGGGGSGSEDGAEAGEDGGEGVFAGNGGDGEASGGDGSDDDGRAEDGEGGLRENGGGGGGAGWIFVRVGDASVAEDVETSPGFGTPSVYWQLLR